MEKLCLVCLVLNTALTACKSECAAGTCEPGELTMLQIGLTQNLSLAEKTGCPTSCSKGGLLRKCKAFPMCMRLCKTECEEAAKQKEIAHCIGASSSYQPPISSANATPTGWWARPAGFISAKLLNECPPWGEAGKSCLKDSIALAARYIRPPNRCGEGGFCPGSSCVNFNKGLWYPEYNRAGFCIKAAAQGYAFHNLAYVEKVLAVNPTTSVYFLSAMRWAQMDAPARVTCDSFCKGCDQATEYCPDYVGSPIAQGEHGQCKCYCRNGSKAADFDRCTTLAPGLCNRELYCSGHGEATFSPSCGENEGTCACRCDSGWSGRNCELKSGEPCNINDCNHRTHIGLTPGGNYSGTRPNCHCACGTGKFNFNGDVCKTWLWPGNGRTGTANSTSTNFSVQDGKERRMGREDWS